MPHKKKSSTRKVAAGTGRGVVSRKKPASKPVNKPKKPAVAKTKQVAARKLSQKSKKSRKV